jgi:predicted  nucleic acid-binding Zn-ribbon protein
MKKFAVTFIILAVLYFVVGYVFVILGYLEQTLYNQIATIVGGLASILGLLGLVLPALKTSDIKTIEIETLKSLAKTAEEIQKKEAELNTKQNDLTKLELQKQELEFLVRKASLNLFFKEQMERYYETLDKLISDNKEISRTINEIKELEYKIVELEIEIEKSPNTENILKIIEEARKHRKTSIEIKTPFDAFFRAVEQIVGLK